MIILGRAPRVVIAGSSGEYRREMIMSNGIFTRADACDEVKRIIDAGGARSDEFDLGAILDEIGDAAETLADRWDVSKIDSAEFWDIMARHAREL